MVDIRQTSFGLKCPLVILVLLSVPFQSPLVFFLSSQHCIVDENLSCGIYVYHLSDSLMCYIFTTEYLSPGPAAPFTSTCQIITESCCLETLCGTDSSPFVRQLGIQTLVLGFFFLCIVSEVELVLVVECERIQHFNVVTSSCEQRQWLGQLTTLHVPCT